VLGVLTAVCIATNTYAHGRPCACAEKPIHTAGRVYSIGLPVPVQILDFSLMGNYGHSCITPVC